MTLATDTATVAGCILKIARGQAPAMTLATDTATVAGCILKIARGQAMEANVVVKVQKKLTIGVRCVKFLCAFHRVSKNFTQS